ncbi:MAG TPA: type II secretion system protein N [Chiayiivirga sp.]|nr:type II secretion system protein N [Chiayiivirga sp.]
MSHALTLPLPLRVPPWLLRVVVLIAFALCAWQAVGLLWLILAGPNLPLGKPAANLPGVQAPVDQTDLAKWHLFGSAPATLDLASLAQSQIAETALKLTLRGTFNESDPKAGIAIIADETGADKTYRAGDDLPGNAKLEQILTGVVVLSRAGVRETLSLRLDRLDDAGARAATPRARTSKPAPLPGSLRTGSMPITIAPNIAPGVPDMASYRAANLPNVQELAKQVQVAPVFANNRMRGVRLSAGRDSDILERAGLKPTDVVLAVNGVPLDGIGRQAELLNKLQGASRVQLEVERDGKTIKLQFGQ